jgi:hypothetical protein
VHFGIADAGVISQTIVESVQTQPAPLLQTFQTGELVSIASVGTNGVCELKALLLARKDVASVRNGVWHANGNTLINVEDTWRTVLTYGRTGNFERTAN